MAGGGEGLSRAESRAARRALAIEKERERTRASARLGLTLRSILLSPTAGFGAALAAAARRARAGSRPEGVAPYLLSAVGGAAVALLWLKIGAIAGLREVCDGRYVGGYVAASAVLGALLSLIAQMLWGAAAPAASRLTRAEVELTPSTARLIWGAAAFPQVFGLVLLLPLDLLIVGSQTFTTERLADTVSTAWAAFSLAVGLSLLVWSLYLLTRGIAVAGRQRTSAAAAGSLVAVACYLAVVVAFVAISLAAGGGGGCLSPRG